MEYQSSNELLDYKLCKLSCPFTNVEEKNDCKKRVNLCAGGFFNNGVCNSYYDDLDEKFYGFDTPKKDKLNYIVSLMKRFEVETSEDLFEEKDVIDGIEFLSFYSEQELMDFTKTQMQDLRANVSDDGLEILDDGTFSNISSNHPITPTKTKDITRIKGWRNKNFAGINICDDSGSSLRNDDDGFGDDIEIKSILDESSEELESIGYAASNSSKNGYECEFMGETHVTAYKRISSPVIEDSNAVDNAEVFNFETSSKKLLNGFSSSTSKHLSPSNINNILDFSFDNLSIKGIFTSDELPNTSGTCDQGFATNTTDYFLLPSTPQNRKSKSPMENKTTLYKSRIKPGFLENIAKKVSNEPFDEECTALVSPNKDETKVKWHVSNEKLLSGNIYDLVCSTDSDQHQLDCNIPGSSDSRETFTTERGNHVVSTRIKSNNVMSAFQSITLDHYTSKTDKLHIDFTIDNLKAADNVTNEEIALPVQANTTTVQERQNTKPVNRIKAKTLAEKRKLLAEDQYSKSKQNIPLKLRSNTEVIHSKQTKSLIKQKRQPSITSHQRPLGKSSQLSKSLFDKQGVITYGKEKPLKSLIGKSLVEICKRKISSNFKSDENPSKHWENGMILNIGMFRPLFKEANDNIKKLAFDDEGNITAAYAAFSSCAVQNSRCPFTVKRVLVPVVDETLQQIMSVSKNTRQTATRRKKSAKGQNRTHLLDINLFIEAENETLEETNQFAINNQINDDVYNVVTDLIKYVDRKENFESIGYKYDPDVPIPYEQRDSELPILKTISDKKKQTKFKITKTKLQRQIESLGGTFIAEQEGEEENEDNLAKSLEEKKNCVKDSCKMGCVCPYGMLGVEHCGKESCMFACQCPPFVRKQRCEIKSKTWLLPEVLRHHNVSQSKLAPVEREYHQTVIMSKDKRITIETTRRKRERKLPSKYKDEILFDYKKGLGEDNDDTFILTNVENDKKAKQNRQEYKESLASQKKCSPCPKISPLKTNLKNPTIANDCALNLKPCYVKIEQDQMINQKAAELCSPSGKSHKMYTCVQRKRKCPETKSSSRNVARKKTGYSTLHSFDVKNFCSRTNYITDDYVMRNYLGTIITKDYILNPFLVKQSSVIIQSPSNNSLVIKEDLVNLTSTDSESENKIEEKNPNEEERGLQIKFVHSIPPHLFEEQDQVNRDEEKTDKSNAISDGGSSELPSNVSNTTEEMANDNEIVEQDTFFYAALPKFENECKWWVVEVDYKKFTHLIYYSEKRELSLATIKKVIFDAQFNNSTIKIVLKNLASPFKDQFGAYVVGGYNHLIFFGPYEPSETHGLTAIRHEEGKFVQIPFITKNSKSDNFQSLGVNVIPMHGESSQSSLNAVNAVWLFSTGKKGTLNNVAKSKSVQTNIFNLSTDSHTNCSSQEIEIVTDGNEIDLTETVEMIEDDITIEQDPVKIETFDCYEDSILCSSKGENSTDINNKNKITDCHIATSTNYQENIVNVQSEKETGLNIGNPVKVSNIIPALPSTSRSLLKKNVAEMKTSSVPKSHITSVKMNRVIGKKRKQQLFSPKKKHQKQNLKKEDKHIVSLRKKIENLKNIKEAIISKKMETRKENLDNTSEIDLGSDTSSLSDDDIYIESLPGESSTTPSITNESNKRRVVHKPLKDAPKSQAPKRCELPDSILQNEKSEGPCPEKAFLCLTPGIGYIPVVEFDPMNGRLVIEDPCNSQEEHMFPDKCQAVAWLNKFFQDVFIFEPMFDMQWVIMHGTIIRKLLPLNKDIFKFKNKSLVVRPSGLEMKHSSVPDEDIDIWGKRELSLLNKTLSEFGKSNGQETESPQQIKIPASNLSRHKLHEHSKKEQVRRMELARLFSNLGKLVYPVENPSRLPKVGVLKRSRFTCESQKIIEESMLKEVAALRKKRNHLNQRLKSIFADILDPEIKKKAFEVCKHIRCYQYKKMDKSEKYQKAMIERENELVTILSMKEKNTVNIRPPSTLSMSSSSSSSGSIKSVDVTSPNVNQQGNGAVVRKPREGVLIKSKLRSLAANRPHLRIYPAANEVINLVDSDDEEQTIEIESEEEDVIWLPPKRESQPLDDDVEIVSSNFKPKRAMLLFPKPKKNSVQQPNQVQNCTTSRNLDIPIDRDPLSEPNICDTPTPAPVALVMSPAIMEQHRVTAERNIPETVPEFVAVNELDYEALNHELDNGCCRTNPVPEKYRAKVKLKQAYQRFIPIQQSSLAKNLHKVSGFIKTSNINTTILKQSTSQISLAGRKKIVLLKKSEKGYTIANCSNPLLPLPHLTPLSVTPVTITESTRNDLRTHDVVTPDRANTVTLHHPDKGISETKTVKFANLNSVQVAMNSPSLKPGPKIRKPRNDSIRSIKVIFPKKN